MVKRKQHIGIFLHNEMGISLAGISPMCGRSSTHLQKIFFLKSIAEYMERPTFSPRVRGETTEDRNPDDTYGSTGQEREQSTDFIDSQRPVDEDTLMVRLPAFIERLLQDSPGARAKLVAAWDGLSVETQIAILSNFHDRLKSIPTKVGLKALESSNAYVRYVAASGMHLSRDPDDRVILDKIETDSDPLVRYSRFAGSLLLQDEASIDLYLELPFEARLSALASLYKRGPSSETFVKIIYRALATHAVSETELVQMVNEYLSDPNNMRSWVPSKYAGHDAYVQYKDFEALWSLVPDVPLQIGYALVEKLPGSTADGDEIPDEILNKTDKKVLEYLLLYDRFHLQEFRRKIAFSADPEEEGFLLFAATVCHFDLTDEEFYEFLTNDIKRLKGIHGAEDMRLVIQKAAEDYFGNLPDTRGYSTAERFERMYENRLKRMNDPAASCGVSKP